MKRPDFLVIGLERAGGHWVAALLNAHPNIACFPTTYFVPGESRIGELHFFNTIASLEEPDRAFTRSFEDFSWKFGERYKDLVAQRGTISNTELIERFKKRYSDICEGERGGKEIVGESSSHYIFFLDWIDRLYPGIKKICILRDPRDRVVSWYKKKIVYEQGQGAEKVPRDFALAYARQTITKEYEILLSYGGSLCLVSYEVLHANPMPEVTRLLEYLGMRRTPEIVRTMVERASFERMTKESEGKTRRAGEESKSPLRKGIVGDYKNAMTSEVADAISAMLKNLETEVSQKLLPRR